MIIDNKTLEFRREIAEYTKETIKNIKPFDTDFFHKFFSEKNFIDQIYDKIKKALVITNKRILIFTFFDHLQNIYHVIPKALFNNEYFSKLCPTERKNCLMRSNILKTCGKTQRDHCLYKESFERARKIAVEVDWFRDLALTTKLLKNLKVEPKPMVIDFVDNNNFRTRRRLKNRHRLCNRYYLFKILENKNIQDNEIEEVLKNFKSNNGQKVEIIKSDILSSGWIKENKIPSIGDDLYDNNDWKIFLLWIRLVFLHSRTIVVYPLPSSKPTGLVILAHKDLMTNKEIELTYNNLDILLSDLFIHTLLEVDNIQENQLVEKSKEYANVSILIDSFAHNIAAHSLSALSTYFAKRKNMLEDRNISEYGEEWKRKISISGKKNIDKINAIKEYKRHYEHLDRYDEIKDTISISDLMKHLPEHRNLFSLEQKTGAQGSRLLFFPIPVDDAIYNYLIYLNEKSEFWSGVIQGESSGGEIASIFDVLWNFVNNPLFIGTIVTSEKIHKIKFKINGKDFVRIDFSAIDDKDNKGNYRFLELLNDFKAIKEKYENKNIFLPGKNVGKQSLYTIFENIIRNIKHYKWNDIEELVLAIDISKNENGGTYSFNVRLEHTNFLDKKKKIEEIVKEINTALGKGTFNYEMNQPLMGGNPQCLLCSRQLFTNDFNENSESSLNELYAKNQITVKNISGCINYSFRIWKGENIGHFKVSEEEGVNNYARYKILIADAQEKEVLLKKDESVIRIVELDDVELDDIVNLQNKYGKFFSKWLLDWLNEKLDNQYIINFDTDYYKIISNKISVEIKKSNSKEYEERKNKEHKIQIGFFHGDANEERLNIRTHGIFKKSLKSNLINSQFEIVETLLTGVYIIDNRISNIYVDKKNIELIEDKLLLYVGNEHETSLCMTNSSSVPQKIESETVENLPTESERDFICEKYLRQNEYYKLKDNLKFDEKRKIINVLCRSKYFQENEIMFRFTEEEKIIISSNLNFLVVHLSFIESIFGQKYKGKNITNFVKKIKEGLNNRKNFKLIITTGRGRTDWREYIKNYKQDDLISIVTFRSPASIKNAMLAGILKNDDFDLKYNLIKVLFSS